jgi:hypothetical protein
VAPWHASCSTFGSRKLWRCVLVSRSRLWISGDYTRRPPCTPGSGVCRQRGGLANSPREGGKVLRRTGRGWGLPSGSSVCVFLRARPRRHAAPSRPRRRPLRHPSSLPGRRPFRTASRRSCFDQFSWTLQRPHPVDKSHRRLRRRTCPLPSAEARAFSLERLGPRGPTRISPGAPDFRLPAAQERQAHQDQRPSC